MSCEMAALQFQAHAYYGTCSIDFKCNMVIHANLENHAFYSLETERKTLITVKSCYSLVIILP